MFMLITVRYSDGQSAGNIIVRAKGLARPSLDRRKIEAAATIASARTDASGQCQLDIPVSAAKFIALLFLDANDETVIDGTRPVSADKIPAEYHHQLNNAARLESNAGSRNDSTVRSDNVGNREANDYSTSPRSEPVTSAHNPARTDLTQNRQHKSYAEKLARRSELNAKFRNELTQAIGDAVQKGLRNRKARRSKIRQLMGKAPRTGSARAQSNFVPPGEKAATIAAEIRARSAKAMQENDARRLGAFVQKSQLPANVAQGSGVTLNHDAAQQMLRRLMPGGAARRQTTLLEKIRARKKRDALLAGLVSATPASDGANGKAPLPEQPQQSLQLDALLASILAGNGTEGAIGSRPDQGSLTQDVAATEVPTGPADSIAYYDYNVLKIAWEDTWTAVIDEIAEREAVELYDSIVEIMPSEKDKEKLEQELEEVDELHDLLDTIGLTADIMSSSLLVPPELASWNEDIAEKWTYLDPVEQSQLQFYYEVDQYCAMVQTFPDYSDLPSRHPKGKEYYNPQHLSEVDQFAGYDDDWFGSDPTVKSAYDNDWAENQADALLKNAKTASGPRLGRVEEMITDLKKKIAQPYRFDIFAPDSYNFGILATYRQQWTPKNYQPGDLAGTITLAPSERRKFSLRRKMMEKSSSKSNRDISSSSKSELEETSRIESEIARSAQNKLNAGTNASIGFDKYVEVSSTTNFGYDHGADSAQTKNEIREATRKSAQEFRDDRKLELVNETGDEFETTEEREISNPNNELTVTYLLYELQRQYTVCERLYNVFPVIYVAFDVPAPHLVDEAWLLEHEWIIRDVLLDDTMLPTLRLLSQDFAGDEVAVEALEQQWKIQIAVVTELRQQLAAHVEMRESARRSIERAATLARMAQAEADKKDPLAVAEDVMMTAVGGVGAYLASELLDRTGKKADGSATVPADESARQALDWADNDLSRAESALREAMTALEVATDKYIAAFRSRLNRRVQLDRLMLHVKSNILHYMQAIWAKEHPDQRYMRLYDLDIQWPGDDAEVQFVNSDDIKPVQKKNRPSGPKKQPPAKKPPPGRGGPAARSAAPGSLELEPEDLSEGGVVLQFKTPEFKESRKLHQIADIENIIAFKGNYAVFRLRDSNALTAYLLQDFLDGEFGLVDPDPLGELPTAEEAVQLAEAAWNEPGTTEEDKAEIADWLVRALEAAHQISQDIVVPSGQLFIEALPGAHPLLEDFKLKHREIDLQKASAEARTAEVELVRRAARLLAGERGDPDVDKRIEVSGIANGALNVDTNG